MTKKDISQFCQFSQNFLMATGPSFAYSECGGLVIFDRPQLAFKVGEI